MEYLYPGVYFEELESTPSIVAAGVSAAAMLVRSERGKDDEVGFTTSFNSWKRLYGGFYNDLYSPYAVKGFFDQGGTRLYSRRVTGSSAAVSQKNLNAIGGTTATIEIDAIGKGAWGNGVGITTTKATTTLASGPVSEDTANPVNLTVASVSGFEVGDAVYITDGSNTTMEFIVSINSTTKVIQVHRLYVDGAAGSFPATDTVISSVTTHSAKSITTALFNDSDTTVTVENPLDFKIGSMILIIDTTQTGVVEAEVETKNGSVLGLKNIVKEPTTLTSAIAIGSPVVAQNFDLRVLENDTVAEAHQNLSLITSDAVNYVETRLFGTTNQSNYVEVDDSSNADTLSVGGRSSGPQFESFRMPELASNTLMTGGLDGSAPSDTEYNAAFTDFNIVDDISIIGVPGVTSTTVIKEGESYARETRKDSIYVFEAPLSDCTTQSSSVQDVVEFRDRELNLNSSWAALYAPWVKVADQQRPNTLITIPPSGNIMGIYSDVAATRGVHKAPANVQIANAQGLSVLYGNQDAAILNPKGINAIRSLTGRGIRVMGARTLTLGTDSKKYVNVRRLINFIAVSISNSAQDFVFEPNNEDLWRAIEKTTRNFLYTLYKQGSFASLTNPALAYYATCDSTTNSGTTIAQGLVVTEIGIAPSLPAEFVVFRLATFENQTEILEAA